VTIFVRAEMSENGAPGESRTPDLLVRSQTLYPAELRARRSANAVKIDYDTEPRSSTRRIAITAVMMAQAQQTLLPQLVKIVRYSFSPRYR
jgi:hypothetical protein